MFRDEVYCQVMRQLMRDPSRESVTRGVCCGRACVTSHRSQGVENDLEAFLYAAARDDVVLGLHKVVPRVHGGVDTGGGCEECGTVEC